MAQELGGTFICVRLDRLVDSGEIRRGEASRLQSRIKVLLEGEKLLEAWIAKNFDAPEVRTYLDGDSHRLDGPTKDWIYKERYEARRRWLDHLIADAERRAEQEAQACAEN